MMVKRGTWALIILGILAALPLIIGRISAEDSANTVDIVYDYQDLITISQYEAHPREFIAQRLDDLKAAGVSSIAVFESTLDELGKHNRLQVYSSSDIANWEQRAIFGDENFTYVLFENEATREALAPMIEQSFAAFDIDVRPWAFTNSDETGLVIEAPPQQATVATLMPDPLVMEDISERGFGLVVRLSDYRPFDAQRLDQELAQYKEWGVNWLVFAGSGVTGYSDDAEEQTLQQFAELLKKYEIGIAAIEMNAPQKGMNKLSYLTDYNVVRLHSIPERESSLSVTRLADRLMLAVKDRNIRMFYLNGLISRDSNTNQLKNTFENVMNVLQGEEDSAGVVERLRADGYEVGAAEAFYYPGNNWDRILLLLVLIGSIALIATTLGQFVPKLLLPILLLGLAGSAGLYVLNSTLLLQGAALGAAVCAPALAIIYVMRKLNHSRKQESRHKRSFGTVIGPVFGYLIFAVAISAIGIVFVSGLLNSITYMLVLEQFRGVVVLKVAPFFIAGLYALFFLEQGSFAQAVDKMTQFMKSPIRVGYVVLLGILGVVGMYYLSRAGNQGQVLPFETLIRTTLENTLGVRPRTQEFLIGHPLLIFGIYLVLRWKQAWKPAFFFVVLGSIGLLNMVGTFTHIHTPFIISLLRSVYGVILGAGFGLVLIGIGHVLIRGWKRWIQTSKQS